MLRDLRYALRLAARSPAFTAVAVLVMAGGIGANTALFSIVDAVLLDPLPYRQADRLVMVWEDQSHLGQARNLVTPADFFDWQARSRSFESMAAYTEAFFNLSGSGEAERLAGVVATPGLMTTLGVSPALGRLLRPEEGEPEGPDVALVSHGLWHRRLGGGERLEGRTVTLNDLPFQVVGVLPRDLLFPGKEIDFVLPFSPSSEGRANRRAHYLTAIGRLRAGVDPGAAQREMEEIARRLEAEYPETNQGRGARVVPLRDELLGEIRPALLILSGAVGFVLLITCLNVATLQLARAAGRGREIAVRAALGAGRRRIAGQLLAEGLLLGIGGGLVGLLLAHWGVGLLLALSPADLPRAANVGLDARLLAFTLILSLATGLLVGLLPAARALVSSDLAATLRPGSRGELGMERGQSRVRLVMVISEVALSLVLLVSAGLLLRSFAELLAVDPGFRTDGVVAMDLSLPRARLAEGESAGDFYRGLLERIEALAPVRLAGATSHLPLSGEDGDRAFTVEGREPVRPGESYGAEYRRISGRYLQAMGIPLLAGRHFTADDGAAAPRVVMVNQALARRFFPQEEALGQRILIHDGEIEPWEIVGVVGDVRHFGVDAEPRPEMYVPLAQRPWLNMTLVVSAEGAGAVVPAVRQEIAAVDSALPVSNVKTLEGYLSASLARQRFSLALLAGFAAAALALSVMGVYGVQSHLTARRRQEMGLRMALGARRGTVLLLILRQGLLAVLAGVATGMVAAFGLTRLLTSQLYAVSPLDPWTFLLVPLLLAAVAAVACYLPARRALRLDPARLFGE